MNEHILLKWGTLKGWSLKSEASREAGQRYFDAGDVSYSAALQHDSAPQKAALCDLIDAVDGEIINDWSSERMTKEQAKKYVMEYGSVK